MIRKGIVSTVDNLNKLARVTFPDMDNNVTYELAISKNVGELVSGNIVIVAFWSESMADGAIIAELR